MSLALSWVLFPALLAAIGAGWGVAVERAAGLRLSGVLVVPLGLAAAIVVASLLTAWSVTAPAAAAVVGVGAAVGLVIAKPFRRLALWPTVTALAVLFAYGAPVVLSGSATFAGYFRLDDTATLLAIADHVISHGRSLADLPPSTYSTTLSLYMGAYPLGGFMLLGVGHVLTGIDTAWIYQPYLACCAVAVGLCVYALVEPVVGSPRQRALVAFLAAQPALLYGYALWGAIKELTAAFLLVLTAALLARLIMARPESRRGLLPAAVATAALIVTLGAGAAAWVLPALVAVVIVWVFRARRDQLWAVTRDVVVLGAMTAVLALPMWVVLSSFLGNDSYLFSSGGLPVHEKLGNLFQALSGWQVAGIWPIGDFRLPAPTVPTVLLIGLALVAAAVAIWLTVRRRQFTVAAYVALALVGCGIIYLAGSTPWVMGKALAIASPALLAAALVGGVLLWSRRRAGLLVLIAIGGGVVWSNALAYHYVALAPRPRLAELQHIGDLIAGKGPTFVNEYEYYAALHFLRSGAAVEPAESPTPLPLRSGVTLAGLGWADLDSFPLSTLEPYRSIVTRRSPSESRPPSIYRLAWQGRYYQLWQRPVHPSTSILEHVPFGESNALPYCGGAVNGPTESHCSLDPAAVPPCRQLQDLSREALRENAQLLTYTRPEPVVVRADQTYWPRGWSQGSEGLTLVPNKPGTAISHIALGISQRYELWLDGSFARGFEVSVDGRRVGRVKDELGGWVHVADLPLTAGIHTFALTYPNADLTPGSGDNQSTILSVIALQPQSPPSELITVSPQHASRLCGRPLDWIELVRPSG